MAPRMVGRRGAKEHRDAILVDMLSVSKRHQIRKYQFGKICYKELEAVFDVQVRSKAERCEL